MTIYTEYVYCTTRIIMVMVAGVWSRTKSQANQRPDNSRPSLRRPRHRNLPLLFPAPYPRLTLLIARSGPSKKRGEWEKKPLTGCCAAWSYPIAAPLKWVVGARFKRSSVLDAPRDGALLPRRSPRCLGFCAHRVDFWGIFGHPVKSRV